MHSKNTHAGLGPLSALIVDDNPFDRRRLMRLAQDTALNITFAEADGVPDFTDLLDRHPFDVIFVDLNLAGDDGIDLLPLVRAHPLNAEAAMIMIAGSAEAESALRAVQSGFADYIEKDMLTPAGLERATTNAVQKLHLAQAADIAASETETLEELLRTFAVACSDEMRPMMARMLRQVRQIKADAADLGLSSANIADIEATCARMDGFFEDLCAFASEGRLRDLLPEADARSAPRLSRAS